MAIPTGFGGRDYPDFGIDPAYDNIPIDLNFAELAARLGEKTSFTREGLMYVYDGFKHGLTGWTNEGSHPTVIPLVSTKFCALLPYSVLLPVTNEEFAYTGIKRTFPYPFITNVGFEIQFMAVTGFKWFVFEAAIYIDNLVYSPQLRVNHVTKTLELRDKLSAYQTISTNYIQYGDGAPFNVIKMVFDCTNKKYLKCQLNDEKIDISSYYAKQGSTSVHNYLGVSFRFYWYSGAIVENYIDSMIITLGEQP